MRHEFNQRIIEEFRANGGQVSGPFEGARLLLLTTTGARSGTSHTTPVGYLPDADRVLVIASAGGAPHHPAWFHNLVAHPRVTVEDGVFTYAARAVVQEGAERERLFGRAVEADPGWATYQAKTTRTIPVVALHEDRPGTPNATSPGAALTLVHNAFRRELALVRAEIAESGPGLGSQLRVNCLTLCQGLRFHHTAEDAGLFPSIAERSPELEPALDRMRQEHSVVDTLLNELRAAITAVDADPTAVLAEVDRLTGELERHFTYEEEQLVPLLDETS